jgi:hypothetical protein
MLPSPHAGGTQALASGIPRLAGAVASAARLNPRL